MLLKAGLGFKKIQFTSEDNLMEKVCSDDKDENNECVGFPQLKHSGGFELLRCQANSRELTVIDCPWTVKGLKKFIGSQTKIYIRPIQQNLSTEPIRAETVEADIREACRNCGLMIPVQCLRSHCLEGCQDMQTQHEVAANSRSETYLYTSQGNSDEELPESASEIIHQQGFSMEFHDLPEISSITSMVTLDNVHLGSEDQHTGDYLSTIVNKSAKLSQDTPVRRFWTPCSMLKMH
ncbi:hypothetical protein DPMN_119349 [Dreissena polymorpha]|uniref:Uncharacterized protein n=1 Tax=Dreissena polymorpha TaxID=45954 RepID=A0A9D4GIH6_DREPO|nr:hypothetical protein DPMN_119349 [Dreissena polymorpha]